MKNNLPHTETTRIIDTDSNTLSKVNQLKEAGITTVIRYYSNDEHSSKRLTFDEAQALSLAGININVLFDTIAPVQSLTEEFGSISGRSAFRYATSIIEQPKGSVIYFSIDDNPSEEEIKNNVIPYFRGINQVLKELSESDDYYQIGALGSGLVCNVLWSLGLCSARWLSEFNGYLGTFKALEEGKYELRRLYSNLGEEVAGMKVNYNEINRLPKGAFMLKPSHPKTNGSGLYSVEIGENKLLNLRKSASIDSEKVEVLKKGQVVHAMDVQGKWACIKAKCNGKDHIGFTDSEYLVPIETKTNP